MDVLSSELAHDYNVFQIRKLVVRAPRGEKPLEYHVIERRDSVQVVAVTTQGQVILVEQERHATQQPSLEFVAGLLDAGENPQHAAARELGEETGYEAAELQELAWYYTDPAILTNKVTLFFAAGCVPSGSKNEDEGEEIRIRVVSEAEVEDLIADGAITHGLSITAWHMYQMRVQRSRSRR